MRRFRDAVRAGERAIAFDDRNDPALRKGLEAFTGSSGTPDVVIDAYLDWLTAAHLSRVARVSPKCVARRSGWGYSFISADS